MATMSVTVLLNTCPNGYTSTEGEPCKPCNDDYYGSGCIEKCSCINSQRCDNVKGCVNVKFSQSTEYFETSGSFTTSRSSGSISTSKNTEYGGRFTTSRSSGSISTSKNTEYETSSTDSVSDISIDSKEKTTVISDEFDGITKQNLLIYSTAVTGIILVLVICHFCYRHRISKRTISVVDGVSRPEHATLDNENESADLVDRIYHTIDETAIRDHDNESERHYFDVISGSSTSESEKSYTEDMMGYLQPCHSIQTSLVKHNSKNSVSVSEESKHIIVGIKKTAHCISPENNTGTISDAYLNEANMVVHQSETSSSESEDENRHSSGYLNPYQPIIRETTLDGYEKPPTDWKNEGQIVSKLARKENESVYENEETNC